VKGVKAVVFPKLLAPHLRTAEDRELEHRIVNFLDARHVPQNELIEVEADNGTVVIRGRLSSFHDKWLCVECCRHVAGVLNVIDEVTVRSSASADPTDSPRAD
jgi:osmotically-inducible protein OsmY